MITRDDTRLTEAMIDKYVDAGFWTIPTLPELVERNAREAGDHEGFVDAHQRITWRDLHDRSRRLAASLLDLGVRRGDVVGIQLPNRVEFVVALAAINQVGAVACPYDMQLREREAEFILDFSDAVATFVSGDDERFDHCEHMHKLVPSLPSLRNVIAVGGETGAYGFSSFAELVDRPLDESDERALLERAPGPHDVNRLLFTSGSTGDPKGVLHTYATTMFGNYRQNEHMDVDENSVLLLFLPAGLNWGMFQIFQTIIARCRLVLLEAFEPGNVLATVAREGVTMFGSPPTGLIALLRHPEIGAHDLGSLRLIATSGASCPIEILRRTRERLGCQVLEGYGMTEVGWISCTSSDEAPEETVGTVGEPFPWMFVRLLEDDAVRGDTSEPVPGDTGEVAVGGPCVCVGYYRNQERNRETYTSDGWFRTGDIGTIDEGGRLRVVGRTKDVIKHGGASVFPREIEEILYTHPKIQEVAVVGVPDEYFGENGCACVIPAEGHTITLDEVVEFLTGQIAKYKLPQQLEIMDSFPLTSTGKLRKKALRERVMARAQSRDLSASAVGDAR